MQIILCLVMAQGTVDQFSFVGQLKLITRISDIKDPGRLCSYYG